MNDAKPSKRPPPFDLCVDYDTDSEDDDAIGSQSKSVQDAPKAQTLAHDLLDDSNKEIALTQDNTTQDNTAQDNTTQDNTTQDHAQDGLLQSQYQDQFAIDKLNEERDATLQPTHHSDLDSLFEDPPDQDETEGGSENPLRDDILSPIHFENAQMQDQDVKHDDLKSPSFNVAQASDDNVGTIPIDVNVLSDCLEGQATFSQLAQGFSDEEGEDRDAWNRDFQPKKDRKASKSKSPKSSSPKSNKSPRRDDDDIEVALKAKKARRSIFGGHDASNGNDTDEGHNGDPLSKVVENSPDIHYKSTWDFGDLPQHLDKGEDIGPSTDPGADWNDNDKVPLLSLGSPNREAGERFDRVVSGEVRASSVQASWLLET